MRKAGGDKLVLGGSNFLSLVFFPFEAIDGGKEDRIGQDGEDGAGQNEVSPLLRQQVQFDA